MYVVINDTWQNITARSINDFVKVRWIVSYLFLITFNLYNVTVFDDYIAILCTAFIDNMSSFNQYSHGLGIFTNGVGV